LICNIFKTCWENFEKANRVAGSMFDMSPILFDASLSTFSAPTQTTLEHKRQRDNSEHVSVAPNKKKSDLYACQIGGIVDQYALLNFGRQKADEIEAFLRRNPEPRSTLVPLISKDDKAIALIGTFQHDMKDLAENHLLQLSGIKDSVENRDFLKSLVVDGHLLRSGNDETKIVYRLSAAPSHH